MVKQKKPFSPLDAHSLGFSLLHQISFLITTKIIGYVFVFTTKMVVFPGLPPKIQDTFEIVE
jgi:hypothetical protein